MINCGLKPRIVVLGAAGFIGFFIAEEFTRNGFEVVVIDNLVRGEKDKDFNQLIQSQNTTFCELDLSQEKSYENLFRRGDLVYNCAALNGTQNFYTNPFKVIQNSAIPAILAAKYAALAKVKRYTYFGSSESYAGGLSLGLVEIPTKENVPLTVPEVSEPRWSYATSKTMGEVAAFAAQIELGLEIQVLRIHNVYGPRMGDKHVIPDLVRKFANGDMTVHGVNETRSFFYIDDLINILVKLSYLDEVPKLLNVGSEREILIFEVARRIAREMGIENELIPEASLPGSVLRRCPDVQLLRSLLDYTETPIEVGISRTVKWYMEGR